MRTESAASTAEPHNRGRYKRLFDLVVLTMAHVVLAPLFILLWSLIPLLVWLDDGRPVFYRQKRVGRGGEVFDILKFRTMVRDADKSGIPWTLEDDLRITRVGKFLRKLALDELPELLSIWRGKMSLVGPRALPVEEQRLLEEEIPGFGQRLQVRPGLTGLAQVYDTTDDAHQKLRYDLEYMQHMSLWLDLKLLSLSVLNTLTGRWDARSGKARGD